MEKAEREHHQWISHGLTMEKASRFTIINIHQLFLAVLVDLPKPSIKTLGN